MPTNIQSPSGENSDFEDELVCVERQIGGFAIYGAAIRRTQVTATGTTVTFFASNTGTVIPPGDITTWEFGECAEPERLILCDANGEPFIQVHRHPTTDDLTGIDYFTLDGNPMPADPPTPYGVCGGESSDFEDEIVCIERNIGGFAIYGRAIRRTETTSAGTTVTFFASNTGAEIPAGDITTWEFGECADSERLVLCDVNGNPFIQVHRHPTTDNPAGIDYFTLDGNPMPADPPTPYGVCGGDNSYITESVVLGCLNGDPVKQVTVKQWNGTTFVTEQVAWFQEDGSPVPNPAGITFGACNNVVNYQTTAEDVTGGAVTTFTPTGNLVAWTVRNRNATTATIQVNGGAVLPLDEAETISASLSGHDVDDILNDTILINPGDGAVRVTTTRRV